MQSTLKETQNYRTKEESRRQQADEVAQAEMMKKIEILKRELGAQRRMLETVVEVSCRKGWRFEGPKHI